MSVINLALRALDERRATADDTTTRTLLRAYARNRMAVGRRASTRRAGVLRWIALVVVGAVLAIGLVGVLAGWGGAAASRGGDDAVSPRTGAEAVRLGGSGLAQPSGDTSLGLRQTFGAHLGDSAWLTTGTPGGPPVKVATTGGAEARDAATAPSMQVREAQSLDAPIASTQTPTQAQTSTPMNTRTPPSTNTRTPKETQTSTRTQPMGDKAPAAVAAPAANRAAAVGPVPAVSTGAGPAAVMSAPTARDISITAISPAAAATPTGPERVAAATASAPAPAPAAVPPAVSVQARPADADLLQSQASAAIAAGRRDEALSLLRAALALDPSAHTARQALLALLGAGPRDAAWLAALDDAASASPERFALVAARGHAEAGRVDAALRILARVPERARGADHHTTAGVLLARAGRHAEALPALRAALATLGPDAMQSGTLRVAIAASYDAIGDRDRARASLEDAIAHTGTAADVREVARERLRGIPPP